MTARFPALRLPVAAAAALVAAAGCTIYDGRDIAIERFDTQPVDQVLRLQLRGSGDRARLAIDGRDRGSFPVGPVLSLDVSGVGEGEHLLEARLESGRAPSPARSGFRVERGPPRLVAVQPPPGRAPPGPLTVEFTFSHAVTLEQAFATGDGAVSVAMGGIPIEGGKTWRVIQAQGVAEDHAQLTVHVTVADPAGRRTGAEAGPYTMPTMRVAFDEPAGPGLPWVAGVVRVAVRVLDYDVAHPPLRAQLVAGAVPIAELGLPPWSAVDWDTRTAPEGSYRLEVKVPGQHVLDGIGPAVVIDRTRPVVSCAPEDWDPGLYRPGGCIAVRASERVTGAGLVLRADGVAVGSLPYLLGDASQDRLCPDALPPAPFQLTLDASGMADDAGLTAVTSGCTFSVPVWGAREVGPLAAPSTPALASEVAFEGEGNSVAWIGAPGAESVGVVRALLPAYFGFRSPALVSSPAAVASQVTGCGPAVLAFAWVETQGGSSRLVMATGDMLNDWQVLTGLDATVGARSPACRLGTLVWSQPDGNGRRDIRTGLYESALFGSGAVVPWGSGLRSDPANEADAPSLAVSDLWDGTLVAFLETAPGAAPGVRLATGRPYVDSGWTPLPGTLNLDPAAAASDPVAWVREDTIVAWVEGGKVLARVSPGFPGASAFGAATVLNADPARVARWPRLVGVGAYTGLLARPGAVAAWVENGPAGDEIRARRWDGTSWSPVLPPANAGVPGAVRWLSAAAGPQVLWVTDDGTMRLRFGNL